MKSKIFKIFLLLFSSLNILLFIYKAFISIRSNIVFSDYLTPNEILGNYIEVFFYAFTIFICIFIIIKIILSFRIENVHHFFRYTYEEYKAIMDKKKADKQEKKKQKLQQQLNDLENTD